MQSRTKIIWLFIGLIIIGGAFIWIISRDNTATKIGEENQYTDPLSHETVSSPTSKTPDTYGSVAQQPLYLGFDKLISFGLGFTQLSELKTAFYNYSIKQPEHLKQVSIAVDGIQTEHDTTSSTPKFDILFDVQFDRKGLNKAKVEYQGLNDVHLYLSDSSGKIFYDSGTISPSE